MTPLAPDTSGPATVATVLPGARCRSIGRSVDLHDRGSGEARIEVVLDPARRARSSRTTPTRGDRAGSLKEGAPRAVVAPIPRNAAPRTVGITRIGRSRY